MINTTNSTNGTFSSNLSAFLTALSAVAAHNTDVEICYSELPYNDAFFAFVTWEFGGMGKHPERCLCWECTGGIPGNNNICVAA